MNNYFSKSLYIQGLKKIRVSGTAFSIIIILLNAILPIIGMAENRYSTIETRIVDVLGPESVAPFDLLIFILVPIIVYDMFSFLNDRSKSDFWHAIPQKRTCVYISLTAAILTWAISTILISTLVNSFLWTFARWYELKLSTAIIGTLPFIVLAVMMTGVMLLAMTLTGTAISNFLVVYFSFCFSALSVSCLLRHLKNTVTFFMPITAYSSSLEWNSFYRSLYLPASLTPRARYIRIGDS